MTYFRKQKPHFSHAALLSVGRAVSNDLDLESKTIHLYGFFIAVASINLRPYTCSRVNFHDRQGARHTAARTPHAVIEDGGQRVAPDESKGDEPRDEKYGSDFSIRAEMRFNYKII
jgi:hypothetical protein